jgi:hypothetical protein
MSGLSPLEEMEKCTCMRAPDAGWVSSGFVVACECGSGVSLAATLIQETHRRVEVEVRVGGGEVGARTKSEVSEVQLETLRLPGGDGQAIGYHLEKEYWAQLRRKNTRTSASWWYLRKTSMSLTESDGPSRHTHHHGLYPVDPPPY